MSDKMLDLRLAKLHQQRLLDEAGVRPDAVRERLLESAHQEMASPGPFRALKSSISWPMVVKLGGATAAAVIVGLISLR